tara:strand:- start:104 stop:706 length:603 start_codon:yes stop_codon:yes gene_type:complete
MDKNIKISTELKRCKWCTKDPIYIKYHDEEWGVPTYNDTKIFESLLLETFQAGISWITILRKRDNFKKAFNNFNYKKIAKYSDEKLNNLMSDSGIIRNKLKIESSRVNARAFLKIQEECGSFSKYIWKFVNGKPIQNILSNNMKTPCNTPLSNKISLNLKKRGFKFIGATIIYSHMQAIGMVNDHSTDCFRNKAISTLNI